MYVVSLIRRLAALEEREAGGHKSGASGSGGHGRGGGHKAPVKGLSKADREIQERLEKLREKTPQESMYFQQLPQVFIEVLISCKILVTICSTG